MSTATAVNPPTIIEITFSADLDDDINSPYRGRIGPLLALSSTTRFSKRSMQYIHLGFPFRWEKSFLERDGKYHLHCWLRPFTSLQMKVPPFDLALDNRGDGELGVYLKIPHDTPPYRMLVMQKGKRDVEIGAYSFEKTQYARAMIESSQTVRIEETEGGEP